MVAGSRWRRASPLSDGAQDGLDETVRMVGDHPPGELEDEPTRQVYRVAAPVIVLEDLPPAMAFEAVEFDTEPQLGERDVEEEGLAIDPDRMLGLKGEAGIAEQAVGLPLRLGPGAASDPPSR